MAGQVTKQNSVTIANGFKTEVRLPGETLWTELGRTNGDASMVMNYDASTITFSDGSTLETTYRNMTLAGGLELADLKPAGINVLSSGITERVTTDGTPVSTIPDQVIAAGWDPQTVYEASLLTSSTDSTPLRITAAPVITSITHNAGTPQVLVENTHYTIIRTANTFSGWGFQFIGANMTTQPASESPLTIVYGTNTPVETETIYAGSEAQSAVNFEFRLSYTDDFGNVLHDLILSRCAIDSGALQFGLKGVEAGGVNTMPIAFTATIDTNLPAGRKLLQWSTTPGGKL